MPPNVFSLSDDEESVSSKKSSETTVSTQSRTDHEFFKEFSSDPVTKTEDQNGRKNRSHSANCRLCVSPKLPVGKQIRGQNSYFNFGHHVKTFHKASEEFSKFVAAEPGSEPEPKRMRAQGSLDGVVKKHGKPYSYTEPPQKNLVENVVKCCMNAMIPIHALADRSFDSLVKDIDPRLTWPSRDTIARRHREQADKMRVKLKELLSKTGEKCVALCVDIWSSKRKRGYLGVTVHYINQRGVYRHYVLACPRFKGSHTGERILELKIEVIDYFAIRTKIRYVGTDNGSNMIRAFSEWMPGFMDLPTTEQAPNDDSYNGYQTAGLFDEDDLADLEVDSASEEQVVTGLRQYCSLDERSILVKCVSHGLQLCLKQPVAKCNPLKRTITKLASVISRVNKSTLNCDLIESEFGGKKFRDRCITRWNSNFKMAQRASEFDWNHTALDPSLRLDARQQVILEEFVELMLPYENAFLAFQDANFPTSCLVIPILYGLRRQLQNYIVREDPGDLLSYAEELLTELNTRFTFLESDNLFVLAAFLDPRRKLKWCEFSTDGSKEDKVRCAVLKLMHEIRVDLLPPAPAQSRAQNQIGFLDFQDASCSSGPSSSEPSCETELSLYLDDKDSAENPLDYWHSHKEKFKRLYCISKMVLCAPASTAGVERLFSIAGAILSQRRLSLTDENFENLLFCNVNRELLEFMEI